MEQFEKVIQENIISKKQAIYDNFQKARSGVYVSNLENRKLGRVGQKYGNKKEGFKPLKFIDNNELQKYFDSYDDDLKLLTDDEKDVLRDYQLDDYFEINRYLRGDVDWSEDYKKKIKNIYIKTLDKCFDKFKLKHDLILKRGVKTLYPEQPKIISFFQSLKKDDIYEDRAFVSTTAGGERILDRFRGSIKSGITLNIRVKKGSKVIPMENVSGHINVEFEFLLPRNLKFKVVSELKNDEITVELL